MSPLRQRRVLRRMERAMRRTDPHLAAMLTIFCKICDGEQMPHQERVQTWITCLCRLAAHAGGLLITLARVVLRTVRPVLLRIAVAYAAAVGRSPHASGTRTAHWQSGLPGQQ